MPYKNYLNSQFGQSSEDIANKADELYKPTTVYDEAPSNYTGGGSENASSDEGINKGGAAGFQRGMSGGIGSALVSGAVGQGLGSLAAGGVVSGATMGVGGAGLALMAAQQRAQNLQAEEDAKIAEAAQRKQNQLAAINQMIAVAKGLTVMG